MIPKIIHYCWFGHGEMGDREKTCIASWKKYCPDYELRLWTEENYDVNKNKYMSDAYKEKKWSFVSDYARLDVVYQYGGIYLDTDVELIKSLNTLLDNKMFCGFETEKAIAFGLGFGAERDHRVVKEIMDVYEKLSFYNVNGSLNLTPCPKYQSMVLEKNGINLDNTLQYADGILVLPSDYFCPINSGTGVMNITENTYGIHHYAYSWGGRGDRFWGKVSRWTNRYFGRKISMIICLPYRMIGKIKSMGMSETIKFYAVKYLRSKKNEQDEL